LGFCRLAFTASMYIIFETWSRVSPDDEHHDVSRSQNVVTQWENVAYSGSCLNDTYTRHRGHIYHLISTTMWFMGHSTKVSVNPFREACWI
jgi:hypothetical protein